MIVIMIRMRIRRILGVTRWMARVIKMIGVIKNNTDRNNKNDENDDKNNRNNDKDNRNDKNEKRE